MTARKPISKKVRFEVFKRDSFTCQYCGKKAPDVILEIDHVTPVKHKGKSDYLNLLTSCFDCNRGKGARQLSDDSIITIQRTQVEELQERKNQIEMMLEWKIGLSSVAENHYKKCIDFFNSKWETQCLSETGENTIKTLVKKYSPIEVINATEEAYKKYATVHNEAQNFIFVLGRVKAILKYNSLSEDKKEEWNVVSVALRNARAKYYNYDHFEATKAIGSFTSRHGDIYAIERITDESESFNDWKNELYA